VISWWKYVQSLLRGHEHWRSVVVAKVGCCPPFPKYNLLLLGYLPLSPSIDPAQFVPARPRSKQRNGAAMPQPPSMASSPVARASLVCPCPSTLLLVPAPSILLLDVVGFHRKPWAAAAPLVPRLSWASENTYYHALVWASIAGLSFRNLIFSWKIDLLPCTGNLDAYYYSTGLLNRCIYLFRLQCEKTEDVVADFKAKNQRAFL
jgi:hypothetical protein